MVSGLSDNALQRDFLSCRLLYQIERQFNLPDEKGLTYLFLLIFVREEEIQKSVTKCLLFYI